MKLIRPVIFIYLILALCGSTGIQAKQSSVNPWANDPLAKINFEQNHPQNQEISKVKESSLKQMEEKCKPLTNFCPVCETVEEWPIDFDGDDLAEKAQRRICQAIPSSQATKDIPESYVTPEIIIIFSYDGVPIIYKTTLNSCSKKTSFSTFQRFDFNSDNYDELILSERDLETKDEKINIISFFNDRISELPFVDFTPDLEEFISK
ncbi:MAG: hypothetical protein SFU25_03605, partial [Candidatus Caenarcaniphilales bacterium]|nr:hypothetical protein [Candidatus Caenarcaniphilales bacterium]